MNPKIRDQRSRGNQARSNPSASLEKREVEMIFNLCVLTQPRKCEFIEDRKEILVHMLKNIF